MDYPNMTSFGIFLNLSPFYRHYEELQYTIYFTGLSEDLDVTSDEDNSSWQQDQPQDPNFNINILPQNTGATG